jgi:hypothetical protein
MMNYCERCDSNTAVFAALCNECMWAVLTGTATFTPADVEAMWVEENAALIIEMIGV